MNDKIDSQVVRQTIKDFRELYSELVSSISEISGTVATDDRWRDQKEKQFKAGMQCIVSDVKSVKDVIKSYSEHLESKLKELV